LSPHRHLGYRLFLRLEYFCELLGNPDLAGPRFPFDSAYHDHCARGIATGNWDLPSDVPDPKFESTPYFRPPGYTFFLAILYKIFGYNILVPIVFQMFLGLFSTLMVFWLGTETFDEPTGVLAAGIFSTWWVQIFFEGELLEPVLLSFLFLLLTGSFITCKRNVGKFKGLVFGCLLGYSALVRPNVLMTLPVVIWWGKANWPDWKTIVSMLVLGISLTIVPVSLRNYVVSGEWVLISSNGGINFYLGNNPYATGSPWASVPEFEEVFPNRGWDCFLYPELVAKIGERMGKKLGFSEASDYFFKRGLEYICDSPGEALRLFFKKIRLLFGKKEIASAKMIHLEKEGSPILSKLHGDFSFLLSLTVLGVIVKFLGFVQNSVRTEKAEPASEVTFLVLFVFFFLASYFPFFSAGRYRLPVLPFLTIFSASGTIEIFRFFKCGKFKKGLFLSAAAFGLYFALSNQVRLDSHFLDAYLFLGAIFDIEGHPEKTIEILSQGLENHPESFEIRWNLALAYLKAGRKTDAQRHLAVLEKASPSHPKLVEIKSILEKAE